MSTTCQFTPTTGGCHREAVEIWQIICETCDDFKVWAICSGHADLLRRRKESGDVLVCSWSRRQLEAGVGQSHAFNCKTGYNYLGKV